MNKKGALSDILVWIAISFITLMFLAVWLYGHNILTNTLLNIGTVGSGSTTTNITKIAGETFGQVNNAMGTLRMLAFMMMFMMGISIFITNFFIKAHPMFLIVYILMTIVAVIFAVGVSNAYEGLMSDVVLGDTLTSFTGGSFIMLNLPTWTVIIGLIGAMFLFMGITRDSGLEGGVV